MPASVFTSVRDNLPNSQRAHKNAPEHGTLSLSVPVRTDSPHQVVPMISKIRRSRTLPLSSGPKRRQATSESNRQRGRSPISRIRRSELHPQQVEQGEDQLGRLAGTSPPVGLLSGEVLPNVVVGHLSSPNPAPMVMNVQ